MHLLCSLFSSGTALYSILNPLSVTLPSLMNSNVTEGLSISSITESLLPLALFWDVWASKQENNIINAIQFIPDKEILEYAFHIDQIFIIWKKFNGT